MKDFIIKSWARSERSNDVMIRDLAPKDWFIKWKEIQISLFLAEPKTKIFVIDREEKAKEIKDIHSNNEIILAYLIVLDDHILWCYTKKELRKKKYLKKLLNISGVIKNNKVKCRSMTKTFFYFCKHLNLKIEYLPLISRPL